MKICLIRFTLLILSIFFSLNLVHSQNDTLLQNKVLELSIDNILNERKRNDTAQHQISSVSSRAESYFSVPLSVSVVTKEMIRNAGCFTPTEALRLMPGVLVRETTPGNYDVRIRGFSDIPPAQDFTTTTENMLLVMIDNRPVFNYFSGGTLWETLPIDINDIERIELIRGPAAALYGPNAVNGVIHFITQKNLQDGINARSIISWGSRSNTLINTRLGYRNDKLAIGFSGNLAQLHRFNEEYYSLSTNRYVTDISTLSSYQTLDNIGAVRKIYAFPKTEESLKRFSVNTFVNYSPFKKWQMDLQLGLQESNAIYPVAENTFTPLSTTTSETKYINFKSSLFGNTTQLSYLQGKQEPGRGFLGGNYEFSLLDANIDYNFKFGDLYLKPALNYRQAIYDDRNFEVANIFDNLLQLINKSETLSNFGLSLQADYQWRNLRWVAAIRQDKINVLSKPFYGYQFAFTYQIKAKHLIRINYGKASRSLFIADAFTNYYDNTLVPVPGTNFFSQVAIKGNTNINEPNKTSSEIGYRVKLTEKWALELELFYIQGNDFLSRFAQITPIDATTFLTTFVTQNDQISTLQKGIMVNAEYTSAKSQLRGFLNFQQTSLRNFSPFDQASEQNKVYDINNYRATPSWFGGIYWNYKFSSVWGLNLSTYFFGRHEIWHRVNRVALRNGFNNGNFVESGVGAEVKTKVLLNLKLSYSPTKQIATFINIRNLLNQTNFEYYYTDRLGITVLGGVHLDF